MSTTIDLADAVTAIFDDARDQVLSLLANGQVASEAADSTTGWTDDPTIGWEFVESRDGVSYRWPKEVETYESYRVFRRDSKEGSLLMALAAAPAAEFFGRMRKYNVVFLLGSGGGSPSPVAVFTACDDFEETQQFAAIIRGKGETGNEMFAPGDQLPAGYEHLTIETFRDRIPQKGSFNRLAVIADSDGEMLGHGALQVRTRGLKPFKA